MGGWRGNFFWQGLVPLHVRENLRDQRRILSVGENEGTVWPQAKKCPSEAVTRAGNNPKFPAARVDRHAPGSSCATRKPSPAFCRRSGQVSISI